MTDKIECRICVIVGENDEFVAHHDEDAANEAADDTCMAGARRKVWITAWIAAPVSDEVEIDVPDSAGDTVTASAE